MQSASFSAETQEGEAILHLGRLWEAKSRALYSSCEPAQHSGACISGDRNDNCTGIAGLLDALRHAHNCFKIACRLGQVVTLMGVARLQEELSDSSIPTPYLNSETENENGHGQRVATEGMSAGTVLNVVLGTAILGSRGH